MTAEEFIKIWQNAATYDDVVKACPWKCKGTAATLAGNLRKIEVPLKRFNGGRKKGAGWTNRKALAAMPAARLDALKKLAQESH